MQQFPREQGDGRAGGEGEKQGDAEHDRDAVALAVEQRLKVEVALTRVGVELIENLWRWSACSG